MAVDAHGISRRLRSRCEAIFGAMWLTEEWAHGGHGMTTVQWYMAGRAAPLGRVGPEVTTAVLGTFHPGLVRSGMEGVWSIISPEEMATLKVSTAVTVMERLIPTTGSDVDRALELLGRALGAAEVSGHPLYAGLRLLPCPDRPAARLFRLCDLMREHRSDAHVSAWRSAGFDALGINVLNELWRDVPLGSLTCVNMGFPRHQIEPALDALRQRGLAESSTITPAGRELREDIERATGAQQASIVEALGPDAEELLSLLDPWARAVASASA